MIRMVYVNLRIASGNNWLCVYFSHGVVPFQVVLDCTLGWLLGSIISTLNMLISTVKYYFSKMNNNLW